MLIRTHEYALSQGDYIMVSLLYTLRTWGWIYVLLSIVSLLIVAVAGSLIWLLAVFLWWLAMPFFFLMIFAWHAYSEKNAATFRNQYLDFDDDFLSLYGQDGTTARVPLRNVVRLMRLFSYYLLFNSTTSFFVVPVDSFQSENDLQQFEGLMRRHGLMR